MSDFQQFFEFGTMGPAAGAGMAVAVILYVVFMLFSMGYSLAVYIFQSLGLYAIAERRGIHRPWMAWIPVANMWILGSIADQYRYVAKGQVKNRRKVLLGLSISMIALLLVFVVATVVLVVTGIRWEYDMAVGDSAMIAPTVIFLVSYVAMMVLAVIATVYQYVCLYDLFASCNPNNAVVFLVLGIFFNFLLPFFIFACRKKDLGMPPRKVQVPVAPWQPVHAQQPQAEPEVVEEAPAEETAEIPVEEPTEE